MGDRTAAALDRRLTVLLLVATFGTGVVDAVSYLGLHRVFTANMTGNVVFIGLGLSGFQEVPLARSFYALAGFLLGAAVAGRIQRAAPADVRVPRRCVVTLATVAGVLAGSAVVFAVTTPGTVLLDVLTGVFGLAMGAQAAAARRLAVADVSTVVVTMTLTSFAADSRLAGGPRTRNRRRIAAAIAMLAGALVGALVLSLSLTASLTLAAGIATGVAFAAWRLSRRPKS